MEIVLLSAIIAILIAGIFVIYKKSRPKKDEDEQNKIFLMLNENLNNVTKQMMTQLNEVRRQVDLRLKENADRIDSTAKAYSDVKSHLSKLEESSKRIFEVGKDISTLNEILRSPKLRGNLGELFLGELLAENLPKEMYQEKYTFKNGKQVDAIIKFKDRIMPIDAKFPLENFQKFVASQDEKEKKTLRKAFISDVKKRIDETSEYILPDEGTFDYVLMYIPAENVFYEVIIRDEENNGIREYSMKKHVIPVSPNNFFVYLQTVLFGLRGMQIEKHAKEMQMFFARLKTDFSRFSEEYETLGSHIANAKNKYDQSEKALTRISERLTDVENIESAKTKLLTE